MFVHGCFWHRHTGCYYFRLPKTRPEFWSEKLRLNHERDFAAIKALQSIGWRVAVVWECALRANPEEAGKFLVDWLKSGNNSLEIEGQKSTTFSHVLMHPHT